MPALLALAARRDHPWSSTPAARSAADADDADRTGTLADVALCADLRPARCRPPRAEFRSSRRRARSRPPSRRARSCLLRRLRLLRRCRPSPFCSSDGLTSSRLSAVLAVSRRHAGEALLALEIQLDLVALLLCGFGARLRRVGSHLHRLALTAVGSTPMISATLVITASSANASHVHRKPGRPYSERASCLRVDLLVESVSVVHHDARSASSPAACARTSSSCPAAAAPSMP